MVAIAAPVAELTPESREHLERLERSGAPPIEECTPAQARALTEAGIPLIVSVFGGPVDAEAIEVAGAEGKLPARLYRPAGAPAKAAPVAVFFHGGGWVVGSLESHDDVCRRLAAASGGVLVSVDYRLAPEHPFPAPIEDAVSATRDVMDRADELGIDARRVAVAGDSAGAALATAVARRAVAESWANPPVGQLLVYPAVDTGEDWPSLREFATGHALTARGMRWFFEHYLPDPAQHDHPDATPLRAADLSGMASAHVLVASHDPLRDQGVAYAHALDAAGVPVTVRMAQGLLHGFLRCTAVVPEAAQHLEELGGVLRSWWETPAA